MHNNRVKRLPKIIAGQLIVSAVIIIIASLLILYSQGYKMNWKTFKFYKTGMVLLISDPMPDRISISGIDYEPRTQFSKNFTPGYYDIKISKDLYQDWSRTIYIAPERLDAFKDITLFLKAPKITALADQGKIGFLNSPNEYLAVNSKNDLRFQSHEIWVNNMIVTRLSKPIVSAVWYPDFDHVVYQAGDEIRIIENEGFNDTLLIKLSSDVPSKFAIGNKGRELYYTDNNQYYQAQIH